MEAGSCGSIKVKDMPIRSKFAPYIEVATKAQKQRCKGSHQTYGKQALNQIYQRWKKKKTNTKTGNATNRIDENGITHHQIETG